METLLKILAELRPEEKKEETKTPAEDKKPEEKKEETKTPAEDKKPEEKKGK